MPAHVTKTDGKYRVSTPGGIKSKGSTMRNAMAQKRLLNAVEHSDWRPTGKSAKKGSSDHMMKKTAMMMRDGGHRA